MVHNSLLPEQRGIGSKMVAADLKDFKAWQNYCEQILAKPFPPVSSAFPLESLESDRHLTFEKFSNWEIVCQEILDTEFSHIYYQKCYDELRRRGKTEEVIFTMRRFAWYTGGWLNFAMMLWDWVSLDESDLLRAIQWLFEEKQISYDQRIKFEELVKQHIE